MPSEYYSGTQRSISTRRFYHTEKRFC